MTTPHDRGQDHPGRSSAPAGFLAGAVPEDGVDVLYLAGQRLPAAGVWLLAATAEARTGGEFTAVILLEARPQAHGGDVLIHLSPASAGTGQATMTARVRVLAVAARSVVLAGSWDRLELEDWPEQIRATAAFTLGVLGELRDHGADLGTSEAVDLESAGLAVAGFPGLPVFVSGTPR
ncbi:MAG: hypothetical protein ACRDNF_06620 [Streptosporangiaceae bacterium]